MEQVKQWGAAIWQFLRMLIASFVSHGGLQQAGSLAYTTLLSLVPLMTVAFAVFSAFPVADRVAEQIQSFVFDNFMPASGEVVQTYLAEFSSKAANLTGVSSVVLLVIAVMLMATIEQAFNGIWEVHRKRKILTKFLIYWAVISLGPVLIGASMLATSYLVSLPLVSDAAHTEVGREISGWIPLLASALAFTLLYWLVPDRPVKGWHALLGGLFAAILFEWAKKGFALYVTTFPTYQAIYGALAAVPIFLIWLYVSWVLVLLGAEFTHVLGIFGHEYRKSRGQGSKLEHSLQLLLVLAKAQNKGNVLSVRQLTTAVPDVESLLFELQKHHLVQRTDKGKWLLARKLEDISLYDLCCDLGCHLPNPDGPGWPQEQKLADIYSKAHENLADVMGLKLDQFETRQ